MKKLFFVLFFALLPFCFYSKVSFNALEDNDDLILVSENIEYFNDGSYIITRIYESLPVLNRDGTYNKTGTTKQVKYDGDTLVWEYTLTYLKQIRTLVPEFKEKLDTFVFTTPLQLIHIQLHII